MPLRRAGRFCNAAIEVATATHIRAFATRTVVKAANQSSRYRVRFSAFPGTLVTQTMTLCPSAHHVCQTNIPPPTHNTFPFGPINASYMRINVSYITKS